MILTRIELQGFRGIRDRVALDIPSGFVVFTGRNGSGKSTICDSIEFGITGRITKYESGAEKGENWTDYTWWKGESPAQGHFVRLHFQDENGNAVTITRTRSSAEVTGAETLEQALCMGNAVPRHSLIELARTTVLRDETIAAHSLDLGERERYAFVRAALGTDALETVEEQAKECLSELKRRLDEASRDYELRRSTLTSTLAQLSSVRSVAAESSEVRAAEVNLQRLLGEQLTTKDLRQVARQKIAQLRRELELVQRLAREAASIRSELESQAVRVREARTAELANRLVELQQAREKVENELKQLEAHRHNATRVGLERHLANLYEHGRHIGLRDGACPLCRTELSEEQFNAALGSLAAEIESLAKEAAERDARLANLRADLALIAQQTSTTEAEYRVALEAAREFELRHQQLVLAARNIGIPADHVLSAPAYDQALQERASALLELEVPLSLIESSVETQSFGALEERAKAERAAADLAERARAEAEDKLTRARGHVSAIRRAFGEVVEERLALLEPLLQELYARLRPHSDWQDISYRMRGDVRKFLSLRVGQNLNPRFVFSSGQRRAAGLAFLLAVHLSRPWCRLQSLVLDDPVQHIDDFRALHLVELLSVLRGARRQIVCTAEDPALADLLCRRLRTGETGEGAKVELEYVPGDGVRVLRVVPIPPPTTELVLAAS